MKRSTLLQSFSANFSAFLITAIVVVTPIYVSVDSYKASFRALAAKANFLSSEAINFSVVLNNAAKKH